MTSRWLRSPFADANRRQSRLRQGATLSFAEALVATTVFGGLTGISAGVATAVAGHFHWLWVLVPALSGAAILWRHWARSWVVGSPPAVRASPNGYCVAAGAIIAVATVLSAAHPGEHMWAGRDGATYLQTAGWLAGSGRLAVPVDVGPFAEVPQLTFGAPGFYGPLSDGSLRPQFFFALPVLLATAGQLGGIQAMLVVNPLIGGLALTAFFLFARQHSSDGAALLAVTVMGLNPVFVYFTRSTFTEPLSLLFIFSGLLVLTRSADGQFTRRLAGALLGGAVFARPDSLMLLVPLAAVSFWYPSRDAEARDVLRGFLWVAIPALGSSLIVSPWYLTNRMSSFLPIVVFAGAIAAVRFATRPVEALRQYVRSRRPSIGRWLVALGVLSVVFVLCVRPFLGPAVGTPYGIEEIQRLQGLPQEPNRTYVELSGWWLIWHLGVPAFVIGIIGVVWWLYRVVISGGPLAEKLFLATAIGWSAVLIWRPSINPDHIWAMRRFLPITIPAVALGIAWCWTAIQTRTPAWGGWKVVLWRLTSAGAALGVVAVSLWLYSDVWNLQEYGGMAEDFETACKEVSDEGAVLIIDSGRSEGGRLSQGFRSFCHVPVAIVDGSDVDPTAIAWLADEWEKLGRRLAIVSSRSALDDLGFAASDELFGRDYPLLEPTLTRRPTRRFTVSGPVSVAYVQPAD